MFLVWLETPAAILPLSSVLSLSNKLVIPDKSYSIAVHLSDVFKMIFPKRPRAITMLAGF